MQHPILTRLAEVALADGPRAVALVDLFADPRARPRRSRLQLTLGAVCPHCGRSVVGVVLGDWTRAGLEAALAAAGRCRHATPAPRPA